MVRGPHAAIENSLCGLRRILGFHVISEANFSFFKFEMVKFNLKLLQKLKNLKLI